MVFMVHVSYKEFVTTPLVTSMESDSYKTTSLDFPGMEIEIFSRTCKCACNLLIKIYLILYKAVCFYIPVL